MRKRRTKKWQREVFEPLKARLKKKITDHIQTLPVVPFGHGFLWAWVDTGDGLETRTLLTSSTPTDWPAVEAWIRENCPEITGTMVNLD